MKAYLYTNQLTQTSEDDNITKVIIPGGCMVQ